MNRRRYGSSDFVDARLRHGASARRTDDALVEAFIADCKRELDVSGVFG
ncbi:hypothetical protein AB0K25_30900 [Micromonospora sp. NPDC049257]